MSDTKPPTSQLSLAEIEVLIALHESELAALRRLKRGKIAGAASGKTPRKTRVPDAAIHSAYAKWVNANQGHDYGAIKAIAAKFKISTKTVRRSLDRANWDTELGRWLVSKS